MLSARTTTLGPEDLVNDLEGTGALGRVLAPVLAF